MFGTKAGRVTLIVCVQQNELLGTGVFASLNIVHIKYRGFFVERYVCCAAPLREVQRHNFKVVNSTSIIHRSVCPIYCR